MFMIACFLKIVILYSLWVHKDVKRHGQFNASELCKLFHYHIFNISLLLAGFFNVFFMKMHYKPAGTSFVCILGE